MFFNLDDGPDQLKELLDPCCHTSDTLDKHHSEKKLINITNCTDTTVTNLKDTRNLTLRL